MKRSSVPELMDEPDWAGSQNRVALEQNLRDIARYNTLLGANALMLRLVRTLTSTQPNPPRTPFTGLDIGIGSGDFIAYAASRLAGRWVGLDLSTHILSIARATRPKLLREGVNADATRLPFADGAFAVLTCALTVHHLQPAQVVCLFRECARVGRLGFALVDFQRGRAGLLGAWLLTRLTSRNRLTHNDGVQSIRRAYTINEVRVLLAEAGLRTAEVKWIDPIRYAVVWRA